MIVTESLEGGGATMPALDVSITVTGAQAAPTFTSVEAGPRTLVPASSAQL